MGARIRTAGLFLALTMLFVIIGYVLGTLFFGNWILGLVIFLALASIFNIIAYFYSDKIVLRTYRAKIVSKKEAPKLHDIVNRICIKADLPMPKIAIVDTDTPNAFATGRNPNRAVVAATTGLMKLLTDDELEGVLAHEMAHVKDRDILVMSISATIAGAIAFAARMYMFHMLFGRSRQQSQADLILLIVVVVTVPIAAMLLHLGVSRSREYLADKEGAMMIQRPLALARALDKLEKGNKKRPLIKGNPASASLFIVNPFRGGSMMRLFSTHPPIKERIRRLELLSQEMGFIG